MILTLCLTTQQADIILKKQSTNLLWNFLRTFINSFNELPEYKNDKESLLMVF